LPGGNEDITFMQREEVLMPYLRALSTFRDSVRKAAMTKDEGALKEILALCDRLRDNDLVPLGVALDDQEGTSIAFSYPPCKHDS
jgi:cysteinyl-tRNA synthetase